MGHLRKLRKLLGSEYKNAGGIRGKAIKTIVTKRRLKK